MTEQYGFLEVFACCGAIRDVCGGLEQAHLNSVIIDQKALTCMVIAS